MVLASARAPGSLTTSGDRETVADTLRAAGDSQDTPRGEVASQQASDEVLLHAGTEVDTLRSQMSSQDREADPVLLGGCVETQAEGQPVKDTHPQQGGDDGGAGPLQLAPTDPPQLRERRVGDRVPGEEFPPTPQSGVGTTAVNLGTGGSTRGGGSAAGSLTCVPVQSGAGQTEPGVGLASARAPGSQTTGELQGSKARQQRAAQQGPLQTPREGEPLPRQPPSDSMPGTGGKPGDKAGSWRIPKPRSQRQAPGGRHRIRQDLRVPHLAAELPIVTEMPRQEEAQDCQKGLRRQRQEAKEEALEARQEKPHNRPNKRQRRRHNLLQVKRWAELLPRWQRQRLTGLKMLLVHLAKQARKDGDTPQAMERGEGGEAPSRPEPAPTARPPPEIRFPVPLPGPTKETPAATAAVLTVLYSMTPKVGTSGGGGQTPLSAGKCSGLSGGTHGTYQNQQLLNS